ncbi:hypothetical protein TWF281_009284 [Arthrobotrys megalospora]
MEDTLSSPYPARMVTFLVQGTPITFSEEIILDKCPYSKLADIASYSLPGETATVDCAIDDFNAIIEYLKTGKIDESDEAKLENLLDVFRLLEIPIPDHLRFRQMSRNASTSSPATAAGPSTGSSKAAFMDTQLPTYDSLAPTGSSMIYGDSTGVGKIQTEPLTIQQKIALAVEDRLTNLLMEHILPLVEGQATSGIYNGAFIIIPSNSPTLQKPKNAYASEYDTGSSIEPPDDQIISLSISNIALFSYMKLVRLQGLGNTVQFLTQRQVIDELKKQLKARLQLTDPPPPPPPVIAQPISPPPQKKSKWGWGRSWSQTSVDPLPAPVAPILPPPVTKGPIDIRIEEVSMRRMNYMGIYETTTGTVLVVEILIS